MCGCRNGTNAYWTMEPCGKCNGSGNKIIWLNEQPVSDSCDECGGQRYKSVEKREKCTDCHNSIVTIRPDNKN